MDSLVLKERPDEPKETKQDKVCGWDAPYFWILCASGRCESSEGVVDFERKEWVQSEGSPAVRYILMNINIWIIFASCCLKYSSCQNLKNISNYRQTKC